MIAKNPPQTSKEDIASNEYFPFKIVIELAGNITAAGF